MSVVDPVYTKPDWEITTPFKGNGDDEDDYGEDD